MKIEPLLKEFPIQVVQAMIRSKTGILQDQQRLIFEGKQLEPEPEPGLTLEHYNIVCGSTVQLQIVQ